MSAQTSIHVVLLDAHAIIHRAYHALPEFSARGEPTGALFGLASMILAIGRELKPDYLIACYDRPEKTYRHEVYKEYKGTRAKLEEDIIVQLEKSKELVGAFGVPVYEKAGYEADDVVGTIVEKLKDRKDVKITIASGDLDTLQLVSGDRVRVYTLRKGVKDTILYDEKAVMERFGFAPKFLPDYKGLRGDPSDNIVGVRGIGEKTATVLVSRFGGIDRIYQALKKEKEIADLGISKRAVDLLKEGAEEARFSKELATINRNVPIDFSLPKEHWMKSADPAAILALFDSLQFRALGSRVKEFFNVPLPEITDETVDQESLEFKETQVALWLLDSDRTDPELDDMLHATRTKTFSDARRAIFKRLAEASLSRVFEEIEQPLIPVVERMSERGVAIDIHHLENLSREYHQTLSKLEQEIYQHAGTEFNINSPKQLGEILFEKLALKPKNQKKTGTGQKSTKESELEKLKNDHPIIDALLQYRELQKLLSTYIDNLPKMIGSDGRLHTKFLQTGTTTGRMSSKDPNLQNIPIRTDLGRAIRSAFVAEPGYALASFDYSQIELRIVAIVSGDKKLIEIFTSGRDVHTETASSIFNVPGEMVDREMRRQAKVVNFGILYGMGVNALKDNLGTDRKTAERFLSEYFKNFSGVAQYIEKTKKEVMRTRLTKTLFGRIRRFDDIASSIPYIKAAAERMAVNAPLQGTQSDIIKLAMVRIDEYLRQHHLSKDAHLVLQIHDELIYEIKKGRELEIAREIKRIMETTLPEEEAKGVPLIVEARAGADWGSMEKLSL